MEDEIAVVCSLVNQSEQTDHVIKSMEKCQRGLDVTVCFLLIDSTMGQCHLGRQNGELSRRRIRTGIQTFHRYISRNRG